MPPQAVLALARQPSARLMLCEHLAQLEASLMETRRQVLCTLDQELASLRGWRDSLQQLDPSLSLFRPELALSPEVQTPQHLAELIEGAPNHSTPSNVVQLTKQDFVDALKPVEEPTLDPSLEKATMDELNAALAAVFEEMGHKVYE